MTDFNSNMLRENLHQAEQYRDFAKSLYLAAQRRLEARRQELLEYEAEVIQYVDPEPDSSPHRPSKYYLGADGLIWYRTLLDGWRWRGDCRFGIDWERMKARSFPMVQLVGTQLEERGLK